MIAVAAVSRDGYMARGYTDRLDWTGKLDKTLFRLLTHTHPQVVVGHQTHAAMPEHLKGRRLFVTGLRQRPTQPRNSFDLPPPAFPADRLTLDYYTPASLEDHMAGRVLDFNPAQATMAGGPTLLGAALAAGYPERLFLITIPVYLQGGLQLPARPRCYEQVDSFYVRDETGQQLTVEVYAKRPGPQ